MSYSLGLYMLRHGYKTLWEKIIEVENLKVTFNVDIYQLYRTKGQQQQQGSQTVWIDMEIKKIEQRKWHQYDFVIWSPEMKTSLPFWDEIDEEVYYFSRPQPAFFTTALIDTKGVTRGASPVDYLFDNINQKREHSLWAQRDSYAALNGYAGDLYQSGVFPNGNDGGSTRSTVSYQMSDSQTTYTELQHILTESLEKMKATSVSVLHMKTWRYFPRFSTADLAEGMLWRILEMQGKYGMWYIGSSVSFESVKSVMEHNKMLLKHFVVPSQ